MGEALWRGGGVCGLVRPRPPLVLEDAGAGGTDGESCPLPFHTVRLCFHRTASCPEEQSSPRPDVTVTVPSSPLLPGELFLTPLKGGPSQSLMDGGSNFIDSPLLS